MADTTRVIVEMLLAALRAAGQHDPELRAQIAAAAARLAAELGSTPEPAPAPPRGPDLSTPQPPIPSPAPAPSSVPRVEAVLHLGDVEHRVEVRGTTEEARAAADAIRHARMSLVPLDRAPAALAQDVFDQTPKPPPSIQDQCALKAQACRWVVERRRLAGEIPPLQLPDVAGSELIARARAMPNCHLWMLDESGPPIPDDHLLMSLAEAYDAVGEGAALVSQIIDSGLDEHDGPLPEAMQLLATSVSALRNGLQEVDPGLEDEDQFAGFQWLSRLTQERRVYVARHMRLADPAGLDEVPGVRQRLAEIRQALHARRDRDRARRRLLGKVRYHAVRLVGADGQPSPEDWRTFSGAIEELVGWGVPPSDSELRELLLPIHEEMPDLERGPGLVAVMACLDQYIAAREQEEAEVPVGPRAVTDEVRRVADYLRGRKVVLIGGEARPNARAALEQAFGLDELVWVATRAHQTPSSFEPIVARPDTALVLLAIRWSSHSFGVVKAMCDRYGRPFVRLPAGYNPEQVARQIVLQLGLGAPAEVGG